MKKITTILTLCFLLFSLNLIAKTPAKKKFHVERSSTFISSHQNENEIKLSENFDKFTAGSEETPDNNELDDMDEYTQTSGWVGYGVFQAGGSAYIGKTDVNEEEELGLLFTPDLDLSNNSGNYTIKFKARTTNENGDILNVWFLDYEEYEDYEEITITNTWADYSLPMTNGLSEMYLSFSADTYEFLIDDIEITQENASTALGSISQKENNIFINSDLHVILNSPEKIEIYSMSGRLVKTVNGSIGNNIIELPQKGLYIVKVGNTATKVIK